MTASFPDRRDSLFGREPDVHHLVDRAAHPGLTAVVARPLMGKTWTLTEVARRLREEDRHLVGYHESTGGESSHLLYAVSNLYARWLADSDIRKQAIMQWQRHKDELVPRAGQMVGMLFGALAKVVAPDSVAKAVREAFNWLAGAQKDLQTGGLHLPALPYNEALSLTRLVAQVSERDVVLILDAWEKSPSLRAELGTLEAILRHLEDWGHLHVLLAVRNPEVDSTRMNEDAFRRAKDLCKVSPAAEFYELPPMNLTDAKERGRIVHFVQENVRAARDRSEQEILGAIDGYPGVLNFWKGSRTPSALQTWNELAEQARNAQALRYIELDHLLDGLPDDQHAFAARLALFPRLDAERWTLFQQILLADPPVELFHALVDAGVLVDEDFPTYGHDTRHVAARRWFIEHRRPLMRRTAEACVEALAVRITGMDRSSAACIEALVGCSEAAQQAGVNPIVRCLLDAAQPSFDDMDATAHRTFDEAWPNALRRNPLFGPLIAMALFRRGFTRDQSGDEEGAIADYTAVIELPCTGVTEVTGAALYLRGVTREERGDSEGAIADYTALIELPDAVSKHVEGALHRRAAVRQKRGDSEGAIADYTLLMEMPSASSRPVAEGLSARGMIRSQRGDYDGAIADYTAVIELRDVPVETVARAHFLRGLVRRYQGDTEGAFADYTAVIELPDAPAEVMAKALYNRGVTRHQRGDFDGALADYTAVINLPDAAVDAVARASYNRSSIARRRGDIDMTIADCTAVIELRGAPAEVVAQALYTRGVTRSQRGDIEGAIADYTAVIGLRGAPAEQVASALYGRGVARWHRGDHDGAIADLTAATEVPDAPAEIVEHALSALNELPEGRPPPGAA